MPRALLVSFCLAAMLGQSLAGQIARKVIVRDDVVTARAVRWIAAVLRHQPAVLDREVEEIGRWDAAALGGITIELHVIRRLIRDDRANTFVMPGNGSGTPLPLIYTPQSLEVLRDAARDVRLAGLDENDLVTRGILLHTDIALLGDGAGTVLNFADGNEHGLQLRADHWVLARNLAALLDDRSGRLPAVALWYRATLATMAGAEVWNATHADTAVAQVPADAEVLFLAGSHHETLATPQVQASVAGARLPGDLVLRVKSAGEELRVAAALLKRAVDRAPAHSEARIHYGRVLTLLGRAGEALPQLRRAAADATEPEQRYYARLFLGAAAEAANQRAEAQAAYAGAAALFSAAQSPRLALSHLATQAGDRAAAVSEIEPLLALRGDETDRHDPWWTYARSTGRHAEALLRQARERLATRHAEWSPR